ncbi:MAG: ABC transporter ATP-binding protein [Candidatus Rokubacteria bacterium]|nr:ABC transporter ATP-binding protein [Candidatus Rokubacteria bacterium]
MIADRIRRFREIASLFGIRPRQASLLILLGLLYAAFEGVGVGMLFPILQFVERGRAGLDGNGVPGIVIAITRLIRAIGAPVGLPVLIALALVPVFARQVFRYLHQVYAERLRLEAMARVRRIGFTAFLNAGLGFFVREGRGRLLGALTSEIDRGFGALPLFLQISEATILLAVYLVLLGYVALWLVPVAVVAVVVVLVLVRTRIQQSRTYGRRVSVSNGELHRVIAERLAGVRLLKMMGREREEAAAVTSIVEAMTGVLVKICRVREGLEVSIEPVMILGAFVALYVAVTSFGMTLASLGIFLFILLRIVPLLKQVNVARQTLNSLVGSLENVQGLIARARAANEIVGGPVTFAGLRRELAFDRVSFGYEDGEGAWSLQDISFTARKGALTAIVGRSGAGKSTLLDLIPRLREPSAGDILIDGVSVRRFELKSLRSGIGIVDQDGFLFDDTVANNIAYGVGGAEHEAVIHAAKRAHAHEFIQALPQGYDTIIGEAGIRLSVGQRQRLGLARVLLQDPDILLLDEPTSALDSESEQYIQAVLDELRPRKAIIVVAHRLSTIRRAEQIIVLDSGRIVERGDHETLLKGLGTYRQLFDPQIYA